MESQADEKLQVGAGQPVGRRGCGPLSPGLRRRGRAQPLTGGWDHLSEPAVEQMCLWRCDKRHNAYYGPS